MLHPTALELAENKDEKGESFNRYEVAIAAAKCARKLTDKYVEQRDRAEKEIADSKETDRPVNTLIDDDLRDVKAVQLAVEKLDKGEYVIVRKDDAKDAQ